jgi:hypothetical protein
MTAFTTAAPRLNWQMIVVASVAFWLSSSILLDFVIMPSMIFNRIEVLCAAAILTGAIALRITQAAKFGGRQGALWALLLLAIALTFTYGLTPQMSALGLSLGAESTVPALMNQLHGEYWGLELLKLAACAALLKFCLRSEAA